MKAIRAMTPSRTKQMAQIKTYNHAGDEFAFNIIIYTVGHKKRCHFYFYDNFGKCGPILIILLLLDS